MGRVLVRDLAVEKDKARLSAGLDNTGVSPKSYRKITLLDLFAECFYYRKDFAAPFQI